MSDQKTLETLRKIEFFQDFEESHLERLAVISRIVEFPPYAVIFEENEPADEVYALIEGRVALSICTPTVGCRQLTEIGPGELMGWSPLVGRSRLSDTARTTRATSVIAIHGDQLIKLCNEHPEFGLEFMHRAAKVLAQRLTATRLQLLEMTGHRLPEAVLESD